MSGHVAASLELARDPSAPPNAVLSERAVLGLALWGQRFPWLAARLVAEDFFRPWHHHLFELMGELHAAGDAVDPVAVKDVLFRTGRSADAFDVIELLEEGMGVDAGYHVDRILEAAELRAMLEAGQRIVRRSEAGDGDVDEELGGAREKVASIRARRGIAADVEATSIAALTRTAKQRYALPLSPARPTGLIEVDEALNGGLRPGNLVVVGARPGLGKSFLAASVARNVAESEMSRVLLVSMELPEAEVTDRLLANIARVELGHLQNLDLSDEEWLRLGEAEERLAGWQLHVVDGPHTLAGLERVARSYLAGVASGLLVVDYVGRVRETGTAATRERHVGMVAEALKNLALELRVPVLAVSAFSREVEKRGGRPRMSDLRDSGELESNADAVFLLWQEHPEDRHTLDVHLAKSRSGPQNLDFRLTLHAHYGRVVNHAEEGWSPSRWAS